MLALTVPQVLIEHSQDQRWTLGYRASENEAHELPSSALLPPRPCVKRCLDGLGPAEWTRTLRGEDLVPGKLLDTSPSHTYSPSLPAQGFRTDLPTSLLLQRGLPLPYQVIVKLHNQFPASPHLPVSSRQFSRDVFLHGHSRRGTLPGS